MRPILSALSRAFVDLARTYSHARVRAQLHRLSDRQLDDLGYTRGMLGGL